MLTAIVDYSSGNLHSARKAFEKISASNNLGSVVVTSNPGLLVTTTDPKLFDADIFSNALRAE